MIGLNKLVLAAAGACVLMVGACAGTPPGGSTKVASGRCERATGSLFCSDGTDGPTGSVKDTAVTERFNDPSLSRGGTR